MTGFIPREKLTAYQRWELAAFDEEEPVAEPPENATAETEQPSAASVPTAEEIPEHVPVILPTAAEIERMQEEAREQGHSEGYVDGKSEGYANGHAEGFAAGHAEGLAQGQEISTQIMTIMDSLGQAVEGIEQQVAEQLLATAVEIASQVLRQSLRVNPELLLPVVREAVDALQFGSGHPALLAHPGDAALIQARMGDQLTHNNWRIIEDPSLTRGGCRVKLGASEVDATLETRWKRVIESIGVNRDWLETPAADSANFFHTDDDAPHER
ncbi:MAG: flagellar assembly protein FliH [Candidatus Accumulibacter sp.]|jgi:flagellar assembly protein FliH|nr:flagellar assembly protein FliH [Accumulibacter sp.]